MISLVDFISMTGSVVISLQKCGLERLHLCITHTQLLDLMSHKLFRYLHLERYYMNYLSCYSNDLHMGVIYD